MTRRDPTKPPGPPELSPMTVGTGGFQLPEWLDFLRNRFILGGLGLLVVLLLVTIVLVAFGSDDEGPKDQVAASEETPEPEKTAVVGPGLTGQVISTATMRIGPDTTYAILGTIPRGALVSVVGRNADSKWLQVVYPPGSQLRGWIPEESVEISGDISELEVAGPAEGPDIPPPPTYEVVEYDTPVPPPTSVVEATPTMRQVPTPAPTATTVVVPPTNTLPPPTRTQPPPPPTATVPPPPTQTPPP